MKIKALPETERPYEKLKAFGAEKLSDAELLAIIIKAGTKEKAAVEVIYELMNQYNYESEGLGFLSTLSIKEIQKIKGLGEVKAIQLKALSEICKRMAKPASLLQYKITCPENVADILMEEMRRLKQEHFVTILLDTKNTVIKVVTNSIGGLNANVIAPREILAEPIKLSASHIIIVHNHPSGNPYPSENDIQLTCRIRDAGQLMGIHLLDHIIIGNGVFASLKKLKKF